MAEHPLSDRPAGRFIETVEVPSVKSQTAIGITHNSQMTKVAVTFILASVENRIAHYRAVCPRCNEGSIAAAVRLNADGSFAEPPACPALCEACEDQLDAILEGHGPARQTYEVANRVQLKTFTPRRRPIPT